MSEPFDIILPNRRLTITPDESDHLANGFVVGCFDITERDANQGTICFSEATWEYDERGNLITEEIEGVADEIIFFYKEEELASGYVDYKENKITIFNEDKEIIALIEKNESQWQQTFGEKLADDTIATYINSIHDFQ